MNKKIRDFFNFKLKEYLISNGMQEAPACALIGFILRNLAYLLAKRSNALNRYYWGEIVEKVREGNGFEDKDEAHEYIKQRYNSKLITISGQEYVIPKSTAKLSNADTLEMHKRIRETESLNGIWIELPNECGYDSKAMYGEDWK